MKHLPVEADSPLRSSMPRQRGISIGIKICVLIILLIIVASSMTNYIVYVKGFHALEHEIANQLRMTAANAALLIDGDRHESIRIEQSVDHPYYRELQSKLQAFQHTNQGKLRYVYTITRQGDTYIYLVDAAPITDTEDHSPLGAEFPIGDFPIALSGFLHPTSEKKPTWDAEFNIMSQSGYAPIHDSQGNVVGIVGVDMDVTTIRNKKAEMVKATAAATIAGILLALLFGLLFSRYLTKPIFLLIEGTEKIAAGHLDARVYVHRNDEYGRLSSAFNNMAVSLMASNNALDLHRQRLEERVAERTQDLARINQEIRDILDNIGQAILTVNPDLRLNSEHSRFAERIFNRTDFSDIGIIQLLFPEGPSEEQKNLEAWLQMIFFNTFMSWEDLIPLQPVNEICYRQQDPSLETEIWIRLCFIPIYDEVGTTEERPHKLMLIIEDITENRKLSRQMEEREQEYQDNIQQILEFIQMDQDFFREFTHECKEHLRAMEPLLQALLKNPSDTAVIDGLFRLVHTIKGNAGMFNLGKLAGEANRLETLLAAIRTDDSVSLNTLTSALNHFQNVCNEILDFYQMILRERTLDTGRTRSQHRREREYIKAKASEIQRLSDLLEQAANSVQDQEKMAEIIHEAKDALVTMQRIPISRLFQRLSRMVQDISEELGKKVNLSIENEDLAVDGESFDAIADSIIHLLRNALDHGIETPMERIGKGKPDTGTIILSVRNENEKIAVSIEDDGQGLDIDSIKESALKKGLSSHDIEQMSEEEIINLIFLPGFTTNQQVTKISGRGVGMDVIQNNIEISLGGRIKLENKKDSGLKVTLLIPVKSRCREV